MRKNLEHPSTDLLSCFVSGRVTGITPLPPRVSQIFEQEPDTLLLLEMEDRKNIFHLEFQSTNDYRMADRMACYHYLLRLKYRMEVTSVVIYTGNEKLSMRNFIRQGHNYYEYQLIDIRDMDPEIFLHSQRAAEVMLAILTGRNNEDKASMIRQILVKLQEMLAESGSLLDEQIGIFKILGSIRGDKIQQQIIKEEQNMPIMYDLNKVLFYQEAVAKGKVEGVEEVINKMLSAKVPLSAIQAYTGISAKKLQELINKFRAAH